MSLYEVSDVFSLSISKDEAKLYNSSGLVCVLYGSKLYIFNKHDSESPQTLLEFDNELTAAGISEDGSLVAVGDSLGSLHFICTSLNLVFYSQKLLGDGQDFLSIDFSKTEHGSCQLRVFTSYGHLYEFRNILVTRLIEALMNEDNDTVLQVQNAIQLVSTDLSKQHNSQLLTCVAFHRNDLLVSCCEDDRNICVWEKEEEEEGDSEYSVSDEVVSLFNNTKLVSCSIISDGKLLVALTETGDVIIWSMAMMIIINILSECVVRDFILLPATNQDLLCCCTDQQDVCVYDLPTLNLLYTVSASMSVLTRGWTFEGVLYFAEIVKDDNNPSLVVKTLSQVQPLEKLARLLSQEKFTEAFELASKYGLDQQVVLMKKAELLNQQLCNETAGEVDGELYSKVINVFNELEDVFSLCDMILKSCYPSLDCTQNLLLYAKNRVQSATSDSSYSLKQKLHCVLNKLVTYQLITDPQHYSPSSWKSFMEGSLPAALVHCIERGELNSASCIWTRHQVDLLPHVSCDKMLSLLQAVPESVSSNDLGQWIKCDVLPYYLCHYPDQLNSFVSWLIERITRLELIEKSSWPSNASQLLDSIIQLITSNKKWEEHLGLQATQTTSAVLTPSQCSSMQLLQKLYQQLQDLAFAKTQLKLSLTLAEFDRESFEEIVFRLLDKAIAPEVIPSLLQTRIIPYLSKYSLSLDMVLLHYLKHMFVRFPGLTPDSPHEAKAVAVVRSIQDKKVRVEGCVELLQAVQRTQPTWSNSVESLVQECLCMDFPCVKALQKQYDLLQVSCMLFKYGIRDFNYSFSDTNQAWRYVRYILKQDGDNILEDALQIAQLYALSIPKLYMFHVVNLGANEKSYQIIDTLNSLSTEDAVSVSLRTVVFMQRKLEDLGQTFAEMSIEMREEYFSPVQWKASIETELECLKFLSLNGVEETTDEDSVKVLIGLLKKMKALQDEFKEFLPLSVLKDRSHCLQLVQDKLLSMTLSGAAESVSYSDSVIAQYMRYGWLLGATEVQLYHELIMSALNDGDTSSAISISQCLLYLISPATMNEVVMKTLVAVVIKVWLYLKKEDQLTCPIGQREIEWMLELVSFIVENAKDDNLLYCLELQRLCYFLKWVWYHCNAGTTSTHKKIVSQFGSRNHFKEDGLTLEPAEILPLAVDYCLSSLHCFVEKGIIDAASSSCLPLISPGNAMIQLSQCTMQLVSCFDNNGHCQLGLIALCQSLQLQRFISSLTNTDDTVAAVSDELTQSLHHMKDKLTSKVLISRRLDHEYSLALLLDMSAAKGMEKIVEARKHTMSNYSKVKAFCKLSIDFGSLVDLPDVVNVAHHYHMSADWGKRLSQYQISFTQAFRGGTQEKIEVLNKMLETESLCLEDITDYCRDFNIDLQNTLLNYMKLLVVSWSDSSCYEKRLREILTQLTDRPSACSLLVHLLLHKVALYDYSRIEVLLVILSECNYQTELIPLERGLELLACLKSYTRQSPLLQFEKEWLTKAKISLAGDRFPEKWHHLLPFQILLFSNKSTVNIILSAEINRNTLGKILPICDLLKLSLDDVLEEAILQLVETSRQKQLSVKFEDMSPLLKAIQDPVKKLDAAKYLAAHSKGDEAIKCLEFAAGFAMQWKDSATADQAEEALYQATRFQRFLQIKQTEVILQENNISEEEFISLSGQPVQLIMQLYSKLTVSRSQVVSVHDVANKLGTIWNLSASRIRKKLAEEWLPVSTAANRDMDITQLSLMEDPTAPQYLDDDEEDESEEQICLRRLAYLMRIPEELEANIKYLIGWAQSPKVAGGSQSRIKSFQVLFAIASVELIEEISGSSVDEIKQYIQLILFVAELESLHIKTSVTAFTNCNKEGLIRTLWKNHMDEPRALRLMCELCLHYNISHPSLWSKLLEQLLHLNMIPYLRYLLQSIVELPLLWKIQNISSIWYKTLITPLREVSIPPTPYQVKECEKSLKLLQLCPFVYDIDIIELAKTYHSIGMPTQSLVCAKLLPDKESKNFIKEISSSQN